MPTSRKPRKLPGLAVLALWAAPLIVHAVSLIPLNSGMQMTCQFVNNTGGQYTNSQIYVVAISQNSAGQYCHLDAAGDMVPCVAGENGSAYFLSLSAFPGFQFPTVMTSARLYVSLGSPLNIPINPGTPVGIAYPNISNPTDPNINTSFDWIEYNIGNGQIFCNTTQVDMFGISMLMDLYDNGASGPTLNGEVGTTESTSALMSEYLSAVPTAFAGLEGPVRIVAPLHGSFGTGGANAGYFDAYINSVWTQYTTSPLIITLNTGTYTGRVGGDGRLAFTTPGDPNTYYVSEPSTNDVWGGAGNLATGNGTELALEAQICAAFHRHVIDNAANLNNVPAYYLTAPTDYYSSFWHQHNVNAKAYGFCYDDVNEQSSSLVSNNPRAIVLSIGGGAALTPTMTPTPVVSSTWRVNAGSSQYTDSQGNVWSADENYTGGKAAVTTSAIAGALPGAGDQALYQSQRWGNPFSYVFNVPAGSYQVTLKFAETYWTAAGDRVFNVSINGNTVLTNFDIFKSAGGQNIALDEVFNNIAPSSGAISIQFGPASADNAMVDAIQIIPMPSTPTRTPTVTATFTLTKTATPTWTASSTPTLTSTNTRTSSPTPSFTTIPPTATFTLTASSTRTNTGTPTTTATNTLTHTPVPPTVTNTPMPLTATSTNTTTPTDSMTATATASQTPTVTLTSTGTPSLIGSRSVRLTQTYTFTLTSTPNSPLLTPTFTSTSTSTPPYTPTSIFTPSATASQTSTNTFTFTGTVTMTPTKTFTPTPTMTWTVTGTYTTTLTATPTRTSTAVYTPTSTATAQVLVGTPVPFPNPVTGPGPVRVQVILRQPASWLTIKVYTLAFRIVNEVSYENMPAGPNDFPLALTDKMGGELANGLYYLEATTPQGHSMGKWLILR